MDIAVVPSDLEIDTAEVDLYRDGVRIATYPVTFNSPGLAIIPPGTEFSVDSRYEVQSVLNRDAPAKEVVSVRKPLRPALLEFELTPEIDDEGTIDVSKLFDARPFVKIDTLELENAAGTFLGITAAGHYGITGTVVDTLAPIEHVVIDGVQVPVTQTSRGLNLKGPFTGTFEHEGRFSVSDFYLTVTAVNALDNWGWDSVLIHSNLDAGGARTGFAPTHMESVPREPPGAERYAFEFEVKDRGNNNQSLVWVKLNTGVEEKTISLRRRGATFRSDELYFVPESFRLSEGVKAMRHDTVSRLGTFLEETRIRTKPGVRVKARYWFDEAIDDDAIVAAAFLVDAEDEEIELVPAQRATPAIALEEVTVDEVERTALVTGTVIDPIAARLPEAPAPTVTIAGGARER